MDKLKDKPKNNDIRCVKCNKKLLEANEYKKFWLNAHVVKALIHLIKNSIKNAKISESQRAP